MTDIVVDEIFSHSPAALWKALTSGDMIARWLMPVKGFAAIPGHRFTLVTKPAGAWDGMIHCEVLEVIPQERLVYAWRGGDAGNVGYGAPLDTVVTWTLTKTEEGTRLKLVHSGFVLPKNESAHKTMSEGWKTVLPRLGALIYTGGCACGAIRYEISAAPVFSNDCQCRDCQHESGTGHGSHLTFPREQVELKGEGRPWDMIADSGHKKTRFFCSTCGSPVYMTFSAMPQFFTVRAASLDEPALYKPEAVTYCVRGHAWDHLDPKLPKFDKMPTS